MSTFWFGVVVDHIPDDFVEGVVLAEGMEEENGIQPDCLQYVILARARSSTVAEAQRLVAEAASELGPTTLALIADRAEDVVRYERVLASSLRENEVSLKAAFVAFKLASEAARASAMRILELAVRRRQRQFWK